MRTTISTIALTIAARTIAYDNDAPTLALDPVSKAPVVKDGKLVFMNGTTEELVDPSEIFSSRSRITALNGEAMGHRKRADDLQGKFKDYEGLDAKAAREALETVGKLNAKQLIDAGEVDKVRAQIEGSFKGQLEEQTNGRTAAENRVRHMIVDNAFNRSKFIADKIAIPLDMFATNFRSHFTVGENDVITAKGADGNVIYSRKPDRSGVPADFEEAVEILVSQYPNRDAILKGGNGTGTGNKGGGGNAPGGVKTMTRVEFDALSPVDQASSAKLMREGKLVVKD